MASNKQGEGKYEGEGFEPKPQKLSRGEPSGHGGKAANDINKPTKTAKKRPPQMGENEPAPEGRNRSKGLKVPAR